MDAIDLLLATAGGYERTHQLILGILSKDSGLLSCLNPDWTEKVEDVDWEPEGGLFDLRIKLEGGRTIDAEVKLWSGVSGGQYDRQWSHSKQTGHEIAYFLLHVADYEDLPEHRDEGTGPHVRVFRTEAVVKGLNEVLLSTGGRPDVSELARAYRDYLMNLLAQRPAAFQADPGRWGQLQYYEFFRRLGEAAASHVSHRPAIYTAYNPSGPVYILNFGPWTPLDPQRQEPCAYFEFNNGTLCIKVGPVPDPGERRRIRDRFRAAVFRAAEGRVKLRRYGRLGQYMTVAAVDCQIGQFLDPGGHVDPKRVGEIVAPVNEVVARAVEEYRRAYL